MASGSSSSRARTRPALREQTLSVEQAHSAAANEEWAAWYAEQRRCDDEESARIAALQRKADQEWADWHRSAHPGREIKAAGRRPLSLGLHLIGGSLLLIACLVVPWLLPWSNPTNDVVAADLLGGRASADERPDGASDAPPDASAVTKLREATRTHAYGYDVPVPPKVLAAVATKPGPYRTLGRLQIPSLALSVPYGGGVFAETLDKGPGHWPGTPPPGSFGNAVISGHRNTHTRPFKELDELDPGDKIIASYENRRPVTFEVVKTAIVPETDYRDFVLRQPTDPRARQLTLFACHPEGNPVFRIVVQAQATSGPT